ncbi:LysR family transcriptional regulator [Permianibacter sp. IMCC34836]|uniref:LysR family transcriptional regulator n=1 Tax=Permianibacter fluminis TaxID=2738515 RepID=UPI0015568AC2|nr:LysR family transcriptional regulator [Permianibacter fluminis]NQD36720.1 LysR family transcriptional regulator [Permianibacter fluminis]
MALTDRLADMAVFAKVVDASGFSTAARDLDLSKAAVSKAVARLETHLGVRLLNRTTRKLTPTEAGIAFHAYCRQVVTQAEEAEQHLGQLQSAPRGTLRLAVPLSFGLAQVTKVLPNFQHRYPEVEVDLVFIDGALDMVAGAFDLAIEVGEPADSSLIARRLTTSRNVIVASPDYIARNGAPQTPADLARHPCLMTFCQFDGMWEFVGHGRSESVYVSGPFRSNFLMGMREAALAGQGIARMPSFCVADDLASGRLKCLFDDWTHKSEGIYALYPHRKHLPAKVKAAVDFFLEAYGDNPYWDEVLANDQCHC